jgi:type VI secretion system secreted protein Hcp
MPPFDAFLRLGAGGLIDQIVIEGESTDKVHANEIEISSFSWGESNTGGGGATGGGGGKVAMQDFSFAMATSKASPNLMLACATGKHIPQATLTLRRSGFEFLKIKLGDCLVSSYELAGNNGATNPSTFSDSPLDEMSLNFVKIDFLYTVQRTGETVETSFNP